MSARNVKMARICISTPEYLPTGSGIAIACSELASELKRKGIQVDVLSKSTEADIIIRQPRYLPGFIGFLYFWNSAFKYLLENQDDYDLIWIHQPFFLGGNRLERIQRTLVSIHTTYYGFKIGLLKQSRPPLRLYYTIASKLESLVFKSLNRLSKDVQVFAITPVVANEAKMNGVNKPISIMPTCINPNKFQIQKKNDARRALKEFIGNEISNDNKIFLFVGRLNEVKCLEFTVKIFKLYNMLDPSSHLLLVGDGSLYGVLEKISSSIKNIHMVGKVDRKLLSIFYSAADFFILMSRYEGLPMTLIEATHYSLPLILSDISAHRWFSKIVPQPCKLISILNFDPLDLKTFIDSTLSLNKSNSISLLPECLQTNFVVDEFLTKFRKYEL